MALTVDYTLTPFRITILQSDLTLISGTKYSLDVDDYWNLLSDYSDSEESLPHPLMYSRIPSTSSTPSITEINSTFYDLVFEDGLYSVNIINGNTNIREVEVKNQVSVNTNNTTGFIDPVFLEFATFEGAVWINQSGNKTGTAYPAGTPAEPVNNITDAVVIAQLRGFDILQVKGNFTFLGTDVLNDFIMIGQNPSKSTIILTEGASIINCTFEHATVEGVLDGGSTVKFCHINDLENVDGDLKSCQFNLGTIILSGVEAEFIDCWSGVSGELTPIIDLNGGGTNFLNRGYKGGIKYINHTSGITAFSTDMDSGHIILDNTISTGIFILRGIAKLTDNSTGTTIVQNELIQAAEIAEINVKLGELGEVITVPSTSAGILQLLGYLVSKTANESNVDENDLQTLRNRANDTDVIQTQFTKTATSSKKGADVDVP